MSDQKQTQVTHFHVARLNFRQEEFAVIYRTEEEAMDVIRKEGKLSTIVVGCELSHQKLR